MEKHSHLSASPGSRLLARVHGIFYGVTGIWPLVEDDSFQIVTGYKVDFWLAQIVGLLVAVIGLVLYLGGRSGRITREIALLGALSAGALFVADLYAPFQPHATRAYFLDAVMELALVVAWGLVLLRKRFL